MPNTLVDATQDFLRSRASGSDVFEAARTAGASERANAFRLLARAIDDFELKRAAEVAVLGGALLEMGYEIVPEFSDALVRATRVALSGAAQAADAVRSLRSEEFPEADEDSPDDVEAYLARIAPEMPAQVDAWRALDRIYMPAVVLFSLDPQRRIGEAQDLLESSIRCAMLSTGAYWLSKVLIVLHDEPFVALEPASGFGIAGRFGEIADNFQLNIILMGAFARLNPGQHAPLIDPAAVRDALGETPPEPVHVTGHWNLYTFSAIRPDGDLPNDLDTTDWIWNEGTPMDVPRFEGRRVIVLGPRSYARGFSSSRAFQMLRPMFSVEETLSRVDVVDIWQRIAAANRARQHEG